MRVSICRWLALVIFCAASTAAGNFVFAAEANTEATHKQVRSITPEMNGRAAQLHTFCLGPDSNLWMCCQPVGATAEKSEFKGAVLVYTEAGKLVREIGLGFVPQAINFSGTGELFVAGSGKVAKLSADGKILVEKDAPNIGNRDEMMAEMKRSVEAQMEQVLNSYKRQLEEMEKQIAKLKEVPEGEEERDAKRRERRLKLLEQQRAQFETIQSQVKESYAAQMDANGFERLMRATGLAVTNKDVFVSLPVTKGYGYTIYRMNHDLEEAKAVMQDIGGCCGQLDIQADGDNLVVAENTAFQVGFYDRDGKKLSAFGKRSKSEPEGFGSCCNPMNVRCVNGEVLTAESSIGHIKRFSKEGEFLGFVGTASIAGGCKHVAIGYDSARDQHYMMNIDRSNVAVLVPKSKAPAETDEERISREAKEAFGSKLMGTWQIVPTGKKEKADAQGLEEYISQMFAHVEFAMNGTMVSKAAEREDVPQNQAIEKVEQKWHALSKKDGKLEFVVVQDSVQDIAA